MATHISEKLESFIRNFGPNGRYGTLEDALSEARSQLNEQAPSVGDITDLVGDRIIDLARLEYYEIQKKGLLSSVKVELQAQLEQRIAELAERSELSAEEIRALILLSKKWFLFGPPRLRGTSSPS